VQEAYNRASIFDGDVSSLYTTANGVKKKKPCPTLSDWYRILIEDGQDSIKQKYINTSHKERYEYIEQVMKDYVRVCNGSRLYFDGQSTNFSLDSDYPIINFDIHSLNEKYERPIAQTIIMEWMWEVKCKKNSENPAKSQEIVTIFDETHYLLPYPEARQGITNYYRRAAKKNVAVITATQNLNDYMLYPDSHAIFTNAATKMILRCSDKEKDAMKALLNLTDAEIQCVLKAAKGDTYIVSGNSKAFVHIDRLPSEIALTETDMSVRKELMEQGQSTVA
jgi:type IV secretory pathway VirB4 component